MKWKRLGMVSALSILLLTVPVSANDIGSLAREILPPGFTYKEIPGEYRLETGGRTISGRAGQLSVLLPKSRRFSSGYIISAEISVENQSDIEPYLELNLKPPAWRGLIKVNRMITDPASDLRVTAAEAMKQLAAAVIGPLAKTDMRIDIYGVEPLRRFDSHTPYLYTVGYRMLAHSGAIIFPLYSRMYLYPEKEQLHLLVLVTPDEGKGPLVYALDDLAKEVMKQAIGSFFPDMTKEETLGREKEVSLLLGDYEMEKKRRAMEEAE